MWNDAVDLFVTYMGSGIIVAWFVISLIFLFLKEKDSCKRILFIYFPVLVLLLYFNPLFVKIMYGIIGEEIYYRFLWIIPMSMTIAYSVVEMFVRVKENLRTGFAILCALLIMVSGRLIYFNEHFAVADNFYHIPETVVKICDAIAVEGREVMAAFPLEMIQYVRQYDSTICMPYGREVMVETWGSNSRLLELLGQDEIAVESIIYWTKDYGNGMLQPCNFIIVPETTVFIGDLERYGIVLYDTIDGYNIYHDTNYYLGL